MTGSKVAVSRLCWMPAIVVAAGSVLWTSGIARGAGSDCVDATCRITAPDGGRGSGCVFEIRSGQVYVLTAAHVVTDARCQCEFWSAGHQSNPMPGVVTARSTAADAAIVAVPESAFEGRLPVVIPLAPRNYVVRQGQTLLSAGCAGGAWTTAWKGHALDSPDGEVRFLPPPANGRSGSALLDAEGAHIVGVIQARAGDNSHGLAASVDAIYRDFDRQTAALRRTDRTDLVPVQCSGGSCPLGGCPGGVCPLPGAAPRYALPYRRETEKQIGGLNLQIESIKQAWPTLPPPTATPAPAASAGPDPSTVQALQQLGGQVQQHGAAIEQLRVDVPKAIDQAVRPLGEKLGTVEAAVKPFAALKAKLDEDIAAGGIKGKIAEKIEDVAEGGDKGLRKILITGAIVLGALALVAFGVMHLVLTGKGLLGASLDKLAAANPQNATLQAMAGKVDALDAKIVAALPAPLQAVSAAGSASAVSQQLLSYLQGLMTTAPGQSGTAQPSAAAPAPAPVVNVVTPAAAPAAAATAAPVAAAPASPAAA